MRYKEEVKITNGQQHRHHSLQRTAFASYQPLALYLRILRLTRTALSIPDNTPLHFLYGSASKGGEEMMFRSYPDVMTVKQLAAALGIGIAERAQHKRLEHLRAAGVVHAEGRLRCALCQALVV